MSDEQGTGAAPAVSEASPSPTPAPERAAPEPAEIRREAHDAINRTLRAGVGTTEAEPSATTKAASAKPDAGTTETDEPKAYTRDELGRFVQAETDRRENKRRIDAEAKAKKDQERWEMDNDPQAFVERKRQEEAQQSDEATKLSERIAVSQAAIDGYDKSVLDPLMLELPEATQKKIVSTHAQLSGFENRQAIAKDALAALKRQYKTEGAREAEARLRSNPALVKQALVDLRDESEDPVAVSGAASGNHRAPDVNSWLRA